MNQRTIEKETILSGVGLHTGKRATLVFKPLPEDSGINFVRVDLPGKPQIKAGVSSLLALSQSLRRTSLGNNGAEVHTVEHLMAALSGLCIDNLLIEIDNIEIPGLDGSSLNFLEAFLAAGIKDQEKPRNYLVIKEPIFVQDEGASLVVFPAEECSISYTLSYNHPLLRGQFLELKIDQQSFKSELSSARTFCLENEALLLQQSGVGCGANYDNTLVVGKEGVIKNKLRYSDEFVRHKILDLLGDLYVLGCPIKGRIIALKSGHTLNLKLLKKLDLELQKLKPKSAEELNLDGQLDVNMIMKILPHRDPFLFVDRILHLEKGKRVTGLKNVTINDYFFKGHFPGKPVMPGVLIVEAMAQVGGVMMLAAPENRGKLAFFLAADKIKFRKMVVPGDQIIFEVEAGKIKSKTGQVFGKALVDGKVVCEAELMFAFVE